MRSLRQLFSNSRVRLSVLMLTMLVLAAAYIGPKIAEYQSDRQVMRASMVAVAQMTAADGQFTTDENRELGQIIHSLLNQHYDHIQRPDPQELYAQFTHYHRLFCDGVTGEQ